MWRVDNLNDVARSEKVINEGHFQRSGERRSFTDRQVNDRIPNDSEEASEDRESKHVTVEKHTDGQTMDGWALSLPFQRRIPRSFDAGINISTKASKNNSATTPAATRLP